MISSFFSARQFGFLPRSNTTTAALHAISRIQRLLDEQDFTAAVFIDVAKAFDSVDHDILVRKLELIGIQGRALFLMKSYLNERNQVIKYEQLSSEAGIIQNGIPQGSCLSSLLFLIYVNDCLHLDLHGYLQMYADDAILICSDKDPTRLHTVIQTDLETLDEWLYNNSLSFNAQKTKYMMFKTRGRAYPSLSPIIINGTQIQETTCIKYLGLMIDDKLSWKQHIDYVKKITSPFLGMIKRTTHLIPVETRLSIYYAYVHSHLTYLISVWGYAGSTWLKQIQIVQNKAIRRIFWNDYKAPGVHTDDLFKKYSILNVQQLIEYDSSMIIFKLKHNYIKHNFQLPTFNDTHRYETRGRNNYIQPRCRINITLYSLFSQGIRQFNQLPPQMRSQENLKVFKKQLKTYLISRTRAMT